MTRRFTPVGALVIVLAGITAVGCSTGTGAAFQALLDPSSTSVAGDSAAPASFDPDAPHTWWAHPSDGYAMALPTGWWGAAVDPRREDELLDAVASELPGVAGRMEDVLATTSSRLSAVAVDLVSAADLPPIVLVVAQPTEGCKARCVKLRVQDQISALPGLVGVPSRTDHRLPAATSARFDYAIDDSDVGVLRVTSYLVRFGAQAYLVNFVAEETEFDGAEAAFESIAESLRFGV